MSESLVNNSTIRPRWVIKVITVNSNRIKRVIGEPPNAYGIPKEFWDVPKLKDYVSATFGVVYESERSYRFLLHFSGLSFKYTDKRSPRRDEQHIRDRIVEIRAEIAPRLASTDWIVLAADETRVQLEAEILKAWLVRGKRTIVQTERTKEHQNYLGFLHHLYQRGCL